MKDILINSFNSNEMKKHILTTILFSAILFAVSCSKEPELTPKTGNLNAGYLIPIGSMLTDEEREVINQRLDEYRDATE